MTAPRFQQQFELQCSNSCLDYRLSLCVMLLFNFKSIYHSPSAARPPPLQPSRPERQRGRVQGQWASPSPNPATPTPSVRPPSLPGLPPPRLVHLQTSPSVPSRPCASSARLLASCASPLARSSASSARLPQPSDRLPPPSPAQLHTSTHPTPSNVMVHDESSPRRKAQWQRRDFHLSRTSPEVRGPQQDVIHEMCGVLCSALSTISFSIQVR